MSVRHTPGPWSAHGQFVKADCNGIVVAEVRWPRSRGKEYREDLPYCEGNAALIAAAPDTYRCTELLEGLCAWLINRFGLDSPEGKEALFRQREALAALRKARAEPSIDTGGE